MAQSSSAKSAGTLSVRPGISSKLLARKSTEKATASPQAEGAEASFPRHAPGAADVTPAVTGNSGTASAAQVAATGTSAPSAAAGLPAQSAWSDEDEGSFQALLARRKATGVRRAAQASAQLLQPGGIKPNPNTVVAVIVGLVAERGTITGAELVAAMTSATFPHPKARPTDPSWCQGYVAGAIRSGFVAVAPAQVFPAIEHSAQSEPDSSISAPEA